VVADRHAALLQLRPRDPAQSAEQIIDQIMDYEDGTRFMVMAPIVRGRKGEYGKQFEELRAEGFTA
jgi:excinuclease ABC subunit A